MNHPHNCVVPGCAVQARSHRARYCEAHRQRWKRHGHAQQRTVTKSILRPYITAAQTILAKRHASHLEPALREIHTFLADHAAQVTRDYLSGKPSQKWGRIAAQEIGKVVEATDPISCAAVVTAMYLLREDQPRMFVDDTGFRFQLVRMFRAQSETAFGRYWDQDTGTSKTVYRDLSRKATEAIGRVIMDAYARLTAHVVSLARAKHTRQAAANDAIDAAFAA